MTLQQVANPEVKIARLKKQMEVLRRDIAETERKKRDSRSQKLRETWAKAKAFDAIMSDDRELAEHYLEIANRD